MWYFASYRWYSDTGEGFGRHKTLVLIDTSLSLCWTPSDYS